MVLPARPASRRVSQDCSLGGERRRGHVDDSDTGLRKEAQIDRALPVATSGPAPFPRRASLSTPDDTPRSRENAWGAAGATRCASRTLDGCGSECPFAEGYDSRRVGTSEQGSERHLNALESHGGSYRDALRRFTSVSPFRHALIVFGGVESGTRRGCRRPQGPGSARTTSPPSSTTTSTCARREGSRTIRGKRGAVPGGSPRSSRTGARAGETVAAAAAQRRPSLSRIFPRGGIVRS